MYFGSIVRDVDCRSWCAETCVLNLIYKLSKNIFFLNISCRLDFIILEVNPINEVFCSHLTDINWLVRFLLFLFRLLALLFFFVFSLLLICIIATFFTFRFRLRVHQRLYILLLFELKLWRLNCYRIMIIRFIQITLFFCI